MKDFTDSAAADKLEQSVWLEGYGTEDVEADNKDWDDHGDEFWKSMQKVWKGLSDPENASEWADEFGVHVDPFKVIFIMFFFITYLLVFGQTYSFEEDNPMKEVEDPMEEGMRKLEAQDVPSAVLCFEAAVQANPENALAWQYLGTTQAKNEQDPFAIAAFKKCLSLEAGNLTALMGLAISYTNENYQNSACHMLRDWLAQNPKYKDIPVPATSQHMVSSILDRYFL